VYEEHGTPTATARARIDALRFCNADLCPAGEFPYELHGDGYWKLDCSGSARVGGVGMPGYHVIELVVARGDDVRLITRRDELLAFFGTVDTKAEATFLAYRDGFDSSGCKFDEIAQVADGFELEMPTHACALAPGPGEPEWIRLHVAHDGHTKILARAPLEEAAR
jgi:hypothetical protein